MKRLLPNTLSGRAILILVIGLLLSHLLSMAVHYGSADHVLSLFGGARAAERIAAAVSVLEAGGGPVSAPVLDTPHFTIRAAAEDAVTTGMQEDWRTRMVAAELSRLLPGTAVAVRTGCIGNAGETLIAEIEDPGGQHLVVTTPIGSLGHAMIGPVLWELAIMGLGIVGLSAWVAWWLTRPLTTFAGAAERLGKDINSPLIDESGPEEIRRMARSFNGMQERLARFIENRTQMLAAISHDLRTPITRLRIRAEFVRDEDERGRMLATLDEMERMTDGALAFARDESSGEAAQRIDIDALVESVCNDIADDGGAVTFEGGSGARLTARSSALRRGFANLVANAVRYGGGARVRSRAGGVAVIVEIDDDGPGIPEAELERVFAPFYRLERARTAYGSGLGLAVARSVFRSHGGDVTLANRPEGGLSATVTLPL